MIYRVLKSSFRKMSSNTFKGVELAAVTGYLEDFAPNHLAESWDNTGLLLEPQTHNLVKKILLTNDLTENVVREGVDLNVQLIISYHPPIFKPLKSITTATWKERVIGTCLENKIAVYSPHTSWDSVPGGVNDWLCSAFDIKEKSPIIRNETDCIDSGAGRYCLLKEEIKISQAVEQVKKLTNLSYLKLALARNATLDTKISTVGICAGSGCSVLSKVDADLHLTGEMSHHELLDSTHKGSSVILCNHSDSERGFLKEFAKHLQKQFCERDIEVFVSKKDLDPIITV